MVFLIHYNELGLKGKNRRYFEQLLQQRVADSLKGLEAKVSRLHGRLTVKNFDDQDAEKIKARLKKVFGIGYFAIAREINQDFQQIADYSLTLFKADDENFCVRVKRANKDLSFTSIEAEREIGALLYKELNLPVKLKNTDHIIHVEFYQDVAWVFSSKERYFGPGGLPVGSSPKVVSLMSGGIDSPVASWLISKRGAKLIYVHFSSFPETDLSSLEKSEESIEILADWHGATRLYMVQFSKVQKEIVKKCPERLRTVLYRRFMLRIAEKIAFRENAKALLTGDALAQVASQTLENMATISQATNLLVLRPLVGMDKDEVIEIAQKIGTFEISILPQEDSCSFLSPQNPATRSSLEQVLKAEELLDVDALVDLAYREKQLIRLEPKQFKTQ